eukprot:14612589-Alexandrium_andersonii.AAC.1
MTDLVLAACQKTAAKLQMEHALDGNPYAKIPTCKGAVVPLQSQKLAIEFARRFKLKPVVALNRKLYCIAGTPESVRAAGLA